MALRAEFGEDAWHLFDEWSQGADNYNFRGNRARWRSFKPGGGITIGSLYSLARDAGWRDDGRHRSPSPESLAARQQARAKATGQPERERTDEAATAAQHAIDIWKKSSPATRENPYCRRKCIEPSETLREIGADQVKGMLGYAPGRGSDRLEDRCLVVPIKRGDRLSSLQLIDGNGRKHFLKDGVIGGGYWASRRLPNGDGEGLLILIGEGVATVLSARAAFPEAIGIAAMMNSNIPAVADEIRGRYSSADLVVLADLDKKTGEPDKYAVTAAQRAAARLAIPVFEEEGPASDRNDFNDMARLCGEDALRAVVEIARVPEAPFAASASTQSWPEPQPLMSKVEAEPYPVDALPEGIRGAVEEVANYIQAPVPLVASCALSSLSLTAQHLVDVRRDEQLRGPVALYFLTIAESGERKSSVDAAFMAPLKAWQRQRAQELKPEVDTYKGAHATWESEREGVRNAIKTAAKKGPIPDNLRRRLDQLQASEPQAPRVPWLFLGDETQESLAWRLHAQWPSAGLVSSEAGVIFGGHAMGADKALGNLSLLNVLWDGGEHSVGRKTSQSFTLRGARLTCGLQVQEAALLGFIERVGPLARGTGFFARFLIARPQSTQGTRIYREPGPMPRLQAYCGRLRQMLEPPVPIADDGTLSPTLVCLDADAKRAWIAFQDALELELVEGGELQDIRDVASKAAENAARLAALFHIHANGPGTGGLEVMAENFERASRIMAWHVLEAQRFLGELALPADLADAVRLDAWLIARCRQEGLASLPRNRVRQSGPRPVRDGKRLDAALKVLADLGRIRISTDRPVLVEVNPALLGATT